ncbi:MAG: WG repeat-containing protein [Oscillospiraceae bacterium]|nr:WG repeat-containing protein [Oscillospiraceae bacterium]
MKRAKIIIVFTLIFIFLLTLNSCADENINEENPGEESPIYGDPSLFTPDEKYFLEENLVLDLNIKRESSSARTLQNGNIIANLDGGVVLIDENGRVLTELCYNSIDEHNVNYSGKVKYLKCRLDLQDYFIYQNFPENYITDIIDAESGEVIKRYLNAPFDFYRHGDLIPLNISYSSYSRYNFGEKRREYYLQDDPVITDWLERMEEKNTISKNAETPTLIDADDYYNKTEYYKYGYVDFDFNLIIPPVYDYIRPLDYDDMKNFIFVKDGEYYIGGRDGERISEHIYDGIFFAYSPNNMPLTAFRDGKFCVLDQNNFTEITPPIYDLMDIFISGYALVINGGEAFYIDESGKRKDISEIPIETLRKISGSSNAFEADYLFETDITEKIKKYLSFYRGHVNGVSAESNLFEEIFYMSVPDIIRISSEIVPEIVMKRMLSYKYNLDESYFTPEKRDRMAGYGQYRPATNDYIFYAMGLHSSHFLHHIVLETEQKDGEIYEAKVLAVIEESDEHFEIPEVYIAGINNGERYNLQELLPEDIFESIVNESERHYSRFYKLLEIDPELDYIKQAYQKSPDIYKTLTMTFKITPGGLINLIRID